MQIVPVKFIPESFSRAALASWDFNLALQREEGGREKGFKHEKGFPPLLSCIMIDFLKILFHAFSFSRLKVSDESFKAIKPANLWSGKCCQYATNDFYLFNSALGHPTNLSWQLIQHTDHETIQVGYKTTNKYSLSRPLAPRLSPIPLESETTFQPPNPFSYLAVSLLYMEHL
jgi:hypothetical protein